MTEDAADLSRFVVREGAVKDTWMVWDRETRGPQEYRATSRSDCPKSKRADYEKS
jgi:hypothetical protein